MCQKCGLYKTRKNIVVGRGDPRAGIWFVGEAPGYSEDEQGLPFVGRAGKELNKALEYLGLGQGRYYICNIVRCHPVDDLGHNRAPTDEEKAICSEYLAEDLKRYNPGLVVALGRHSACALLGDIGSMVKMTGEVMDFGKYGSVFILLHPAAILHNPDLRRKWEESLERLKEVIDDQGHVR